MFKDEKPYAHGTDIRAEDVEKIFPLSPGTTLVRALLRELSKNEGFQKLFGPYRGPTEPNQRWASYMRQDFSERALPAITVYESDSESKQSDNGWLTGNIRITAYWLPAARRADWADMPRFFKGAIQSWFASKYADVLLDPLPGVNLERKVGGLNELGKEITWSPQIEAEVAGQQVPATILDIRYRIDLRRWYDYLEDCGYSKAEPFKKTVFPWTETAGVYQGVRDERPEGSAQVPDKIISE